MYREQKVALSRQMASLLLCGVLADTLILRSVTTTDIDIEMANYLANIADLDIQTLGDEIMNASSILLKKSADEIVSVDRKEYSRAELNISVSQIEVAMLGAILGRKDELFKSLDKLREKHNYFAAFLLITDINSLSSVLFISSDDDNITKYLTYPEISDNVFKLESVLSRKKQLIPILFEILDKIQL